MELHCKLAQSVAIKRHKVSDLTAPLSVSGEGCGWECKYHVVFTPKYRKKMLFGQIRRHLGELARRKECQIEEGHLMPDHHMLISIPPKYSVAEVIGYLK